MQQQFDPNDRISHVNPDLEKGFRKARKIRGVIERHRSLDGLRVLDAGCGGGAIAALLAESVGPDGRVVGCDMHEQQATREGYEFHLLVDDDLPFDDDSFDLVVSNHVLEHVGPFPAQERYLAEIQRVLAPGGLLYLAVPNRWRLVEHHFDLPLLSWPPRRVADAYVRRTGKGTHYDVHPPSHRDLERLFAGTGYVARDVTYEQMQVMARTEDPRPLVRWLLEYMPRWLFRLLRPVIPTMIYLARPRPT